MPVVVRPSPLLVRLVVLGALSAFAAVPFPFLVMPTLGVFAVIITIAFLDGTTSRKDPPPSIERDLAARMVKGRTATVVYRFSRPKGARTTVSLLDELPRDLGGDLLIDDLTLGAGERAQVSRDISPLRRGTYNLGPTYVLW